MLCNANIHTYTSCFLENKQKDNETLPAYIYCFKTTAKQHAFNNGTVVICIFVKGLQDVHIKAAKIYKKDLKILSEVIRLVEKLNTVQQLTTTLTPVMVSIMSNNDRCLLWTNRSF